jgi:hypothetical protein
MADTRTWGGGSAHPALALTDVAGSPDEPPTGGDEPGWKERAFGEGTLRLRRHIADPFSRNAYPLILNTGLTGLLGIGFWWLAPRYYSDADVGRGSALISLMTLLSGAVAINLTGTLSRFIPQAGRRTARLVCGVYLLSCVVVVVLGGGFLLTLGHWGPTFDLLRNPLMALCFVPAVVVAGIFTIQDAVLTGLRSSLWVPIENTCFGVLKIVLLVLMASAFPKEGLYLSWVVAMVLLVPPINGLIFTRLLPRHGRTTGDRVVPPTRAQIGGFFAGDYVGALFVFGAGYLVPVIVAADVAPADFAHFYLAWTVVGILNLVATNLAVSLTVEGVYDAGKLATNCRAALRRGLTILLVAVAVVALVAPWGFGTLGPGYLAALPSMLALALAALPRAIVEIWIGVLRARGLTHQVARVQIAVGLVVVGCVLGWLGVDAHGLGGKLERITGVGVAVLVGYAALAVAVAPRLRRFLVEPNTRALHQRAGAWRRWARSRRPSAASVAVCALTGVALIAYLLPLRQVNLARVNGLGLISVLPAPSLIALAALALAFPLTLAFPRPRPVVLGAQLVAMVACLHGVAALTEPLPRFPTTWLHVGFVEFIGRAGTVMPDLDARFNWPGFFALIAFVTGKHGWASLVGLMTWTPLVSNLLYLIPFGMVLRNLRASWRAKWFAAWLFGVLNWVGQDYFSPQGFSYLLYLVFVAVVITWFRHSADPLAVRSLFKRPRDGGKPTTLVPGELSAPPTQPGLQVTLLLFLVGLFAVGTFTHQITPFVMLSAITGLVLVRRCTATGLPWLLGVILAAYICYMAAVFWSGHMNSLRAGLGDLIANLLAGTMGRASGGSAEHHAVLFVRLAITVGVFVLAAVGARCRRRRGVDDRVALVLLLAPLPAILESYGGEMVLRVYMFALPGACVLAAYAFFPDRSARRSWHGHLAVAVCALGFVGGFLFARYGNEAYEMIRPGELAAAEYVYQHGGSPVLFLTEKDDPWATPFIPLGYQDLDRVRWRSIRAPSDPREVDAVVTALRDLGPDGYLMTTRGQEHYLQAVGHYGPNWGDEFRAHMRQVPQVRVVAENSDAVVYALRPGVKPVEVTLRRGLPTGVRLENTPWTGVGLFFLVPLLAVLLTREVVRMRLGPDGRWRLLPLTVMAAPLLAVFVAVLIERLTFLTIISPPPTPPESVCDLAGAVNSGSGATTEFMQLQRPAGWCFMRSPFAPAWSENSPVDGTAG